MLTDENHVATEEESEDFHDNYASAAYIRSVTGITAPEAIRTIYNMGVTQAELDIILRHCRVRGFFLGRRRALMTGRMLRLYRLIMRHRNSMI